MAQNDIIVPREGASGVLTEIVLPDATTSARGLLSSSDKTKLDSVASGAEVNVQSNWTEADTGSDAFILNKPSTFTPTAHKNSHAVGQSDALAPSDIGLGATDDVEFASVAAESFKDSSGAVIINADARVIYDGSGTSASDIVFGFGDGVLETALPISFSNDNNQAAANAATTRTNLGLGTAATSASGDFAAASHSHGNINSSGQIGSTAGLPVVTTTAGAVTTLALGAAGTVLTVNSGANGVEFAAASGGGSSIMQSIAVGFVLN